LYIPVYSITCSSIKDYLDFNQAPYEDLIKCGNADFGRFIDKYDSQRVAQRSVYAPDT
jgi:hypothetical protein